MLPILKVETPVDSLGSAKRQRTLGMVAVETNLPVDPKIMSEKPTQFINVTHFRHVHNMRLADPKSNVTGKIDFILGAGVLEEFVLDNQLKDDGVVIRESLFGWIASGAVPKSEIENKNPLFANALSFVYSNDTEDLVSPVPWRKGMQNSLWLNNRLKSQCPVCCSTAFKQKCWKLRSR